nr:HAMP domain-containing histidine kinase [Pyrinomonadaceae bacterium]
PLGVIVGWARLMREGALDPLESERVLAAIERNAQMLKQLVEDLLDVSRITAGKFRVDARPMELVPVIVDTIEMVATALAAKRIKLHAYYDHGAGFVHGDPERLQQVLWNLLSNAIKFTPEEGQIEVRLERARAHARIIVYDTGAGIRRDLLPYVFDRFRQAEEAAKAKHGGLGLGLAIVRHLVEAHGGTVHAASAGEGLGSTFTIELPLLSGGVPQDYQGEVAAAGDTEKLLAYTATAT